MTEYLCGTGYRKKFRNSSEKADVASRKPGKWGWWRVVLVGLLLANPLTAQASSRIKDIVDIEGVRENLLVGYGLVVGLDGTGDSLRNAPFTRQSLESMLERLGVNVRNTNMNTDNVAAVIVTANLQAFARHGTRMDVTVSALGDADSLQGGTLLVTPLLGADGEIYAVSQGQVQVGGFDAGGDASTITKGVPTSGRIPNGAIIEREIDFVLASQTRLRLSLRNPDLTTAFNISNVINEFVKGEAASVMDPSTVQLELPQNYPGNIIALLADVETLRVTADQVARVIIDESSGVIVMGDNVRVSTVAIAQGNLTIRISETPQVSQPSPFSAGGETVTVPRTEVEVDEGIGRKITLLEEGINLQSLVDGLNTLGVTPRDMISILQALKAAGALQAEIKAF